MEIVAVKVIFPICISREQALFLKFEDIANVTFYSAKGREITNSLALMQLSSDAIKHILGPVCELDFRFC